ncbi:MAG: hypothetical protein CSA62_05610 [Planctomycetota bacterium]|nr:MAG: hypothetical protein CSA62_05610 [Planctomycetota bacterium]
MAGRFAEMALACIHREYPNKIGHVLSRAEDAEPPRQLTPMFYGCFDWHSAVHGHWLLCRLLHLFPQAPFAPRARAALHRSMTQENAAGELAYFSRPGCESFERPYGLAWLLGLCQELREWKDPEAQAWSQILSALEEAAAQRIATWLPKLSHPIRTGEHSQSAFSMGLALDWARSTNHSDFATLIEQSANEYYGEDRGWRLAFEPSGQDFLSPGLAEADLMRRVLAPEPFAEWLMLFLPELDQAQDSDWLQPAVVTDKSDGKLVHLDGLNLSRAWMLEGIAAGLPAEHPRAEALLCAARAHAERGLSSLREQSYEGGHWLGSFATYLMSKRGLPQPANEQTLGIGPR